MSESGGRKRCEACGEGRGRTGCAARRQAGVRAVEVGIGDGCDADAASSEGQEDVYVERLVFCKCGPFQTHTGVPRSEGPPPPYRGISAVRNPVLRHRSVPVFLN